MRGRTAYPAVGAVAAALLLAACSPAQTPVTEDEQGAATPPAATTGAAPRVDLAEGRDWGEQVRDEGTGYLVKQVRQWSGVLMDGEHGVVFRVVQLVEDLDCTGEAVTPEQDRFLGVELEVETNPHMAELGRAQFPLAPQDFQVLLADGGVGGDLVGAGPDCQVEQERLAEDFAPGVHQTGMVVLDVPGDVEALVLDGGRYGMTGGWMWPLEDAG